MVAGHTPGQTPVKSPDQKKLKVAEVVQGSHQVTSEVQRMDSQATTLLFDASPLVPSNLSDKFDAATDATHTPRMPVEVSGLNSCNIPLY